MKFIVSQSIFADAITTVSRAVPNRPTHPILGNILLVAEGDKLSITGFDLSMGIKLTIDADILTEGSTTIPAKLFADIIGKVSGDVTFEVFSIEDKQARITHESGKFVVGVLDADEFPELPTIADVTPLSITTETLQKGINAVCFAASTDETKQVLTGVHINSKDGVVEFAATGGHYLSVLTIPPKEDSTDVQNFNITLPAKALNELNRMITVCHPTDNILMSCDDNKAIFEIGENRLICRVLEGAYPAYWQLIPKLFSRTVTVNKKKLSSAIDRVSVLSDQKNGLVKFNINSDEITLSVDAKDFGSAKERLSIDLIGEATEIAFNSAYLKSGLNHIASAEIQINLNEGNQPVTFTPLGGDKMIFLCMPVQILR